jgi:hypothetical protein
MSGHLLDLKIMIPFSTESLSEGSPAIPHILMVTSLPRTLLMVIFGVNLISFSVKASLQIYSNSSL